MKIYLANVIFINRAPIDKLELSFNENEIAVLSSVNGKGKTAILTHIVDAFYEMARPHFENEFEGRENKFYRVSSALYNLDTNLPSIVYLRFKVDEEFIDYVDIRGKCTEEQYNDAIKFDGKIPFSKINSFIDELGYTKTVSTNLDKKKTIELFSSNLLTYFPAYRFEIPGYLNDPYKVKLNFRKESKFSGYLANPIEVVSGLPQLTNWIMDIILDLQYTDSGVANLKRNLEAIINFTLISKNLELVRLGVGPRNFGSTRIQIVSSSTGNQIYPSIFNLSSGEAAMLCLFGEILRQADNCSSNPNLNDVKGIVLIDEVDKHLHIKLQKEVLPHLITLFPNVQFIVSSHSPFLSMGLADIAQERSKIINLDNFGISQDPTNNELYSEVYQMMVNENNRFKDQYEALRVKISDGNIPLIITEGKTDIKHIKKAYEKLGLSDLQVDYFVPPEGQWGDSNLKTLLEQLSKVPQSRKIIGIFDRDTEAIVKSIESAGQTFKDYGNNVYAFCIPVPADRLDYINISIEFYYTDSEIKKTKDGKSLFFDNEVDYLHNKSTNKPEIRKLDVIRIENELAKKIFDEAKMGELADWIHSKSRFADLVETDSEFISEFDFSKFSVIWDKIRLIVNTQ